MKDRAELKRQLYSTAQPTPQHFIAGPNGYPSARATHEHFCPGPPSQRLHRQAVLDGLPRFACSIDKRPLTPRGFYDAVIGAGTTGWPLVGLVMGERSGVDCLDVDLAG